MAARRPRGDAVDRRALMPGALLAGAAAVVVAVVVVTVFGTPGIAVVGGVPNSHHDPRRAAGAEVCDTTLGPTPVHRSFTQALAVPERIDRRHSDLPVDLVMRAGSHRFSPDLPPTATFGYATEATQDDVYLGPTIEVAKDRPVTVRVANQLGAHPLADFVDEHVMGAAALDAAAPRGTVHLHGGHSEPSMDGLPDSTFSVGTSATYRYENDQDATTLWYHDHAWGLTRLQVMAGLAGQYWVRDEFDTGDADNPLGLPTGDQELPLTIQDRRFLADGSFAYPTGPFCGQDPLPDDYPDQWAPESFGDVATVNGVIEPVLEVRRGVYRFHVLNASNARVYHLRLRRVGGDGSVGAETHPMLQIGSDGGLLDTPVPLDDLLLAPAERADLLVDFSSLEPGAVLRLVNDAPAPFPNGGDTPVGGVVQFAVGDGRGPVTSVPTVLRGEEGLPPALPPVSATSLGGAAVASTRTVFLNEIANGDETTGGGEQPVHGLIGNQFYADDSTMLPRTTYVEDPSVNTVEVWEIVNTTADAHPVHLHLTQFRVLNRQDISIGPSGETDYLTGLVNGLPFPDGAGTGPFPAPPATDTLVGEPRPPAPEEAGWKDTVIAYPGTVTRIVVPFGGTAAGIPAPFIGDRAGAPLQRFAGTYVFHCHILEHEDNDMMAPLQVVG